MSRNCRIFGRARPVIVSRRGGQVITMHNRPRRHIASHRNLLSTEGSQNALSGRVDSRISFKNRMVGTRAASEESVRIRIPHYIPNPNSPNPQPKRSLNHLETL